MTQTIDWSEDLLVNVPSIDKQHRELYGSMNGLLNAVQSDGSKETIHELIHSVYHHTETHCEDEEALMRQYEYPDIEPQKKDHDYFAREIRSMGDRFAAGDMSSEKLSEGLVKLADFFSVHIRKLDVPLGAFIHERRADAG